MNYRFEFSHYKNQARYYKKKKKKTSNMIKIKNTLNQNSLQTNGVGRNRSSYCASNSSTIYHRIYLLKYIYYFEHQTVPSRDIDRCTELQSPASCLRTRKHTAIDLLTWHFVWRPCPVGIPGAPAVAWRSRSRRASSR